MGGGEEGGGDVLVTYRRTPCFGVDLPAAAAAGCKTAESGEAGNF